ncbi:uncharacterized protein V6R79_010545 [Siganus canaliculatus]
MLYSPSKLCRLKYVSVLAALQLPSPYVNCRAAVVLPFRFFSLLCSPESFATEILSALCSLVVKSTDKNTCTRALWVISKQSFPPDVVAKKVSSILDVLESVWSRDDIQSVVMEHEALNVVIRMLEQVPAQMSEGVLRWAKLIIPLVVHSASKVRLRAAAAMEMGMPLLLGKQTEVAAIIEPLMSTKLIPELQKLFMSKNETNVLKLWPLFVKLLGKLLHRGGPFINSLLHLEELGFRSSSPTIKKIAFIAWKSLIDNFALNPDILCSSKRVKLLMQPLMSINVRTETLLLTKVEVWWYLVVQLGPNLSSNFDQVSVPLLQSTIGSDSPSVPSTPSRTVSQNGGVAPATPKTGTSGFNSPANTSRMSLNSSVQIPATFPSIQLLGLEMLLHYFLGPEVIATAAKNKLILSLEPLNHPLLSGTSSFTKHAPMLTSCVRDGFVNIGKDAPDSLLTLIWTSLVRSVNSTIESGSKKDRHGSDVLTVTLQALQSIVMSEALPADKVLVLFEATVKGIPQRVLGSASYQVGKMDVLNGTPALFLILLLYNSSLLAAYTEDERFFQCLQTLVSCGLSGPTSPLAFGEAVLAAMGRGTAPLLNKEQLWRMWSVVVSQLTDTISQSNEVNQGDALEHNFNAVLSALLFPITNLLPGTPLQQTSHKSMLSTWSKLYKVFARCSALVVTAEENICCEELSAKMTTAIDRDALMVPSTLNAVVTILQVMVECVDFSPYTPHFQQKLKSPHTPVNWMKKRNKVLGNLSTFQTLLVQCLEVYLEGPEGPTEATGLALLSILSTLFTSLALANTVKEALTTLIQPLTSLYKHAADSDSPSFPLQLVGKLEKLLSDVLGCLQTRSALAYDDELLALLCPLLSVLFPHKNKQLRTSVVQFWNSTFANAVSLTYPDEIRPVLSQVKQKTPIILPGFEVVSVPDELSGQYSSESSQLETKLSGMPVSSVGKRESMLAKVADLHEKGSPKTSKPVSTKLDFGSPKPPRREALEEEASIDFVFIPPETKERVLTEHQKEVKRTKRVDIPAMYNNLDASLDTTVFTQYTQSQEGSLDKLPTVQTETVTEEAPAKVPEEEEDVENEAKTEDYTVPKTNDQEENQEQEEMLPESADASVVGDAKSDDTQCKDPESHDLSASSDLVSGTPQKPASRRQSFITLEKYAEGKPASPSSPAVFTGPFIKTSNSQESPDTENPLSQTDQISSGTSSEDLNSTPTNKGKSKHHVNGASESPVRPKDSGMRCEPVRLTERMSSDTTEDEDVIPDTQTEGETKEGTASTGEELKPSSQDDECGQSLNDSQSPMSLSGLGEPRRSGRVRVRPHLPGEDVEEREKKYDHPRKRRSGEEPKEDSQTPSTPQSRPNTRNRLAAEEDSSRDSVRTRAQRDSSQTNSQGRAHKKIKLYSNSEEFLDKPESRRRSTRGRESSQTDSQSDYESQSQGRPGRRSRSSVEAKGEARTSKVLPEKEQSRQKVTQESVEKNPKAAEATEDSQMNTPSPQTAPKSPDVAPVEQPEKVFAEAAEDCQMNTPSPQIAAKSQVLELVDHTESDIELKKDSPSQTPPSMEKTDKLTDSQVVSSPANVDVQDRTNPVDQLVKKSEVKHKTKDADENLSQEDSQALDSSSDSQTLRRSRRSKASEAPESQDKSESNSSRRQSRSNSQVAVGNPETLIGGRTRRSKVQEEHSQLSPRSNSQNSQSLDITGSESSQGRGKYKRRSSQAAVASLESSESESLEAKENARVPKKRGRKPKASLQSPLAIETKDLQNNDHAKNDFSQDSTDLEANNETELPSSPKSQECQSAELQQVAENIELRNNKETGAEVESESVLGKPYSQITTESQTVSVPPCEEDVNVAGTPAQESDSGVSQSAERLDSVCADQTEDKEPGDPAVTPPSSAPDTSDRPQTSEEPAEPEDEVTAEPSDSDQQLENPDASPDDVAQDLLECPDVADDFSKDEKSASTDDGMLAKQQTEATADEVFTPLQDAKPEEDRVQTMECPHEKETERSDAEMATDLDNPPEVSSASVVQESTGKDLCQSSPMKSKDLEAVMGQDVGQSPSSGRTRGTWSPLASPSTSILKKGQKRPLEEETTSPLVKSRRVSFADPIQQQELADDIDRRSPAVRSSSPRRPKISSIPQPKFVTTPTKGLLVLSPRNLHSPSYKSSKKCLISEMSQEPRPVSRDCIYPALVGCSTPVEAVLPQISSNMWSRGFGQLVRARNIKTVGDLSALTPSEIKMLPIRSPKISNVKKALKSYEQQRKGRGGDELKSFAETEMMTSELQGSSAPQNQDEDEKTSGETLATALVDEPVAADSSPDKGASRDVVPDPPVDEQRPEGWLLSEVETLSSRMTPTELGHCSVQQLGQIHEHFGGLMRRVVVELQTRICQTDGKS